MVIPPALSKSFKAFAQGFFGTLFGGNLATQLYAVITGTSSDVMIDTRKLLGGAVLGGCVAVWNLFKESPKKVSPPSG